jgi:glycosyltransferase involved in cell wall biosynthesis
MAIMRKRKPYTSTAVPAPRPVAVEQQGAAPVAEVSASFRNFVASGQQLFFDIATLREPQFTGIPNVAASLAQEIIDSDLPCSFFIGENIIKRDYLRFLLGSNSGSYFAYHHQLGSTIEGGLLQQVQAASRSVGLFPAEKPFHRLFDFEVQVIHDLSTITTPYFHTAATNKLHGEALLNDIASNDLNICVSEATAAYLRVLNAADPGSVVVAHNGVRWSDYFRQRYDALFGRVNMEPYVVILGTIEPRKNLEVVLRALGQDADLLARYKYIFLGKAGWLLDFNESVKRNLGHLPDNVIYPGFVSEFKKYCLLRRARFTIYPSLYEGFGLPILEAHSLGVPTVFSVATSMPEVGNGSPYGFDPLDANSLLASIYRVETDLAASPQAMEANCMRWAERFSWQAMLSTILDSITTRATEAAA